MEWISIEEKLPDLFRKVLIWIAPPSVLLGYFDEGLYEGKGKWYVVTNKHTVHHITHWMEPDTPQPYVPYSDCTVAFGLALKSKLIKMEIKFKSTTDLAIFIDKFLHSDEGSEAMKWVEIEVDHPKGGKRYIDTDELEDVWKIAHELESFIAIHGHE